MKSLAVFLWQSTRVTQKQIQTSALYLIEITKLYLQNMRIALEALNIKRELQVVRRWGHGPRDDSQSHCSRGRAISEVHWRDHGEIGQVILLVSIHLVGETKTEKTSVR